MGLCSLGSEVPPGFGVGGPGNQKLKAFFLAVSLAADTLFLHPPRWQGETRGAGKIHRVPQPPPPHLCICFPAVSVTSMPFSICFTSFPGPPTPANPGRKRRGRMVISRAGHQHLSPCGEMADNLATRKLRRQNLLCSGHRQASRLASSLGDRDGVLQPSQEP